MGGERLLNFKDEKRLRKVCKLVFSLLNMQIYDVLLSVSSLFLNAFLTFLLMFLFFHVLIYFFQGSFSLMTKFLPAMGSILFFQLLRLLPKKKDETYVTPLISVSLNSFLSFEPGLSYCESSKCAPNFTMTKQESLLGRVTFGQNHSVH